MSRLVGADPAPGLASIGPAYDDGFLWHDQDTFHDSFCQETIELDTGHASPATRPAAVLQLIINAAGAV